MLVSTVSELVGKLAHVSLGVPVLVSYASDASSSSPRREIARSGGPTFPPRVGPLRVWASNNVS